MKFVDLDAPMGGDGLSWDTAYNLFNLIMVIDDEIWIKEHDGYVIPTFLPMIVQNLTMYAGFDSSLTGTDGDPDERHGFTKVLTDGGDHEGLSFFAGGSTISRFWVKDFEHSVNGGAITCTSSGNIIEDCIFEKCKTGQRGGAVYTTEAIEIKGTSFIRCESTQEGGAIFLLDGGSSETLFIQDCLVTNCISGSGGGGGINTYDIEMDRCAIFNNQAKSVTGDGGGINIRNLGSGSRFVRDSIIAKNIAENDFGGIYSSRFAHFTNTTIVRNEALGAAATCSGVRGGVSGSVTNSIVKDNVSSVGEQVVGFPANSVQNSNIDGATGTPGGLGGQEGANCINEPVVFIDASYLNPYKLHSDTGEGTKRGGTISAPHYSGVDKRNNVRETEPSMGAYEELILKEDAVIPLTPYEIIEDLVNEEARAYWTAERIDNALVIDTDPVYYQRIHTTLDLIPVTLRILWNVEANAYFMDIKSTDGTINATGLRLSPGVDILDGLAITELGKMFVTDMHMKKEEPTFDELGDRFVLWYLPRESV